MPFWEMGKLDIFHDFLDCLHHRCDAQFAHLQYEPWCWTFKSTGLEEWPAVFNYYIDLVCVAFSINVFTCLSSILNFQNICYVYLKPSSSASNWNSNSIHRHLTHDQSNLALSSWVTFCFLHIYTSGLIWTHLRMNVFLTINWIIASYSKFTYYPIERCIIICLNMNSICYITCCFWKCFLFPWVCCFCLNSNPKLARLFSQDAWRRRKVHRPDAQMMQYMQYTAVGWIWEQNLAICWLLLYWWWFIVVLYIILYYISRFLVYMQRYRHLACALSWLKAPNCPRAKLKTGQNVFMAAVVAPTHVSHHDATRAAVSTTALGVCAVRVWESKKDPSERPLTNSGRRRRRMMMVNMMILPEITNMTILLESWWGWGG